MSDDDPIEAALRAADVLMRVAARSVMEVDHIVTSPQLRILVRIATRLALNRMRTNARRRESYVGPWLPEPLLTAPDVAEDVELAEEIRNEDDKVDALHLQVFEKVLGEKWKGETVDTVDATLASRYHERFADHAVAIAKKVQYLATGDWVPEDA